MVIECNDICWNRYIDKLPREKQDIYFTSQYCKMNKLSDKAEPQIYIYEEDDNIAIYPYIKRPIFFKGQLYYDIETPYGYGGPNVKTEKETFINNFELAFLEHCRKENIIAEFIRFHPLLRNEQIFRKNIEVLHNRFTVWIDLEKDINEIWMKDISVKNRSTIRKCQKNELEVEVNKDYNTFLEIYNETMHKVGAKDFYFFNEQYYKKLQDNSDYILLQTKMDGKTLAAAIFIKFRDYFHYHLSGSRREFLKYAPNNILLWEAIKYAKNCGCKKMHFGGGLTNSTDDTLFRFKKSFSSEFADFYIGKRIHNQEVYWGLIHEWETVHSKKAKILLQYRE